MKEVVLYAAVRVDNREPARMHRTAEMAYKDITDYVEYLKEFYERADDSIYLDTALEEVVGNIYPTDMNNIGIYVITDGITGTRFNIMAFIMEDTEC